MNPWWGVLIGFPTWVWWETRKGRLRACPTCEGDGYLSVSEAGCQHYNIGPKGCPDCTFRTEAGGGQRGN